VLCIDGVWHSEVGAVFRRYLIVQLFNCAIIEKLNSSKIYAATFLGAKTNPRPSYDDQGFGV
jgi:hypothetical protein